MHDHTKNNHANLFDSKKAFSRSVGWITEKELEKISRCHVGIIGLGGVGGAYAEILARLGVKKFTLCDSDSFSVENTNRQNECRISNYGRNKAEVIAELISDINPTAEIKIIGGAMNKEQVPAFCQAIDVYFDCLDFFEIDLRIEIFRKMRELDKLAITSAPIATGSATIVFTKDSMSFDDYFGLHTTTDSVQRSLLFVTGIAPTLQHAKYMQDKSRANLKEKKVPSLPMGIASCASATATTFLKCYLGRGRVLRAPWTIHYDPYLMTIKKRYTFWGYKNPLQKLKVYLMRKFLSK